jgi:hypothetical protein
MPTQIAFLLYERMTALGVPEKADDDMRRRATELLMEPARPARSRSGGRTDTRRA